MHTYFTRITYLFFLLCLSIKPHAQHICGFDELHQEMADHDTAYANNIKSIEKIIQSRIKANRSLNKSAEEVYTIPVVVHVVYTDLDAPNNISDEQIFSGINRLSEIFANSDNTSINANIQFQLASRTPDCEPTSGIIRVDGSGLDKYVDHGIDIEANDTDGIGASRLGVLNLSRWNPENYLNIWVVNEINNNDGGSGIQAFATLPGTHMLYDGVVVLFNSFGYDYDQCNCFELKSYTDENKVLAHEIGHYLNLYHTFEGDSGGLSCPSTIGENGDKVADTPAHIRTYNCLTTNNYCYPPTDPFYDIDKVIHNYMGYAPESCQYEFTQGQVERMRACLETTRANLVLSQGIFPITNSEPAIACLPQSTQGISAEYGMGIISVQIGNLIVGSGSTFQDGGYLNNWCATAIFERNTQYDINISTFGYYNEDLKVYIDYDNSGSFENEELVFSSSNNTNHIGTFTIPENAVTNASLRTRIISDHFQYNITTACYPPTYGQVEDYSIFIKQDEAPIIERGNALQLDGTDDCLFTNFTADPLSESFTYEFWCKPQGDPKVCQVIFDRTPQNFSTYNFMALWHGRIFVFFGKEMLLMNAAPVSYNEWHHVAYTFDGEMHRLYLNGVLAGANSLSNITANVAKLHIGAFFNNYLHFAGQIDELRLWKEARTGQQIRENMNLTNKILDSEGLTYFHFNDTIQDSLLLDFSKNENAILKGNPSLVNSTVNTGGAGDNLTLSNIITNQSIDAATVDATLLFSIIDSVAEFTITKQEFSVNTLDGINDEIINANKTWVFASSSKKPFQFSITLGFDENTFFVPNFQPYKLYHRGLGSDGPWELSDAQPTAITTSSITFSGITKEGQYIVAK
ncbi:MAG: LamG-like jellyroll fold domain-containing protein [Saprospiraceae bacterium]